MSNAVHGYNCSTDCPSCLLFLQYPIYFKLINCRLYVIHSVQKLPTEPRFHEFSGCMKNKETLTASDQLLCIEVCVYSRSLSILADDSFISMDLVPTLSLYSVFNKYSDKFDCYTLPGFSLLGSKNYLYDIKEF